MESQFSEVEQNMFIALGQAALLELDPIIAYQCAVNHVFCEEDESPAARSLRRCFRSIQNGGSDRRTEAFDSLIRLETVPSFFDYHGHKVHFQPGYGRVTKGKIKKGDMKYLPDEGEFFKVTSLDYGYGNNMNDVGNYICIIREQ